MIIDTSRISMGSARAYKKREITYTRYENTTSIEGTTDDPDFISTYLGKADSDNSSASSASEETSIQDLYRSNVRTYRTDSLHENQENTINKVRNEVLQYLLKILFGDSWQSEYDQLTGSDSSASELSGSEYSYGTSTKAYTTYFEYSETEETAFSTSGTAVTSDGREISFGINLTLSRSFTQATSSSVSYTSPVLIDPLVINLDSPTATIGDQNFFFDLDSDGETEEISSLAKGSGFLALDANENGTIDDGSELFGTKSGNGFEDLAAYDSDGNGWIDEADSVFEKLKVWYKDENGDDQLISLKDAGVGAIYLGSAAGDFSLTDSDNQVDAVIRRQGIFLYESGQAGTIQQLDLAT